MTEIIHLPWPLKIQDSGTNILILAGQANSFACRATITILQTYQGTSHWKNNATNGFSPVAKLTIFELARHLNKNYMIHNFPSCTSYPEHKWNEKRVSRTSKQELAIFSIMHPEVLPSPPTLKQEHHQFSFKQIESSNMRHVGFQMMKVTKVSYFCFTSNNSTWKRKIQINIFLCDILRHMSVQPF